MKEYKNKINELDAHKKEIIKMVKSGCTQKETVTIYAKPDIQGDAAQLTVTNM